MLTILRQKPKMAGLAKLKYEGHNPSRQGDTIILPEYITNTLIPLKRNWNQFLFINQDENAWFGGTDENPFLVQVNSNIVRNYYNEGPIGFYESLVPNDIVQLYELYGKHWKRQGDIFFIPLPFTWDEITKSMRFTFGESITLEKSEMGVRILGTRHIFKGKGFRWANRNILGLQKTTVNHDPLIVEGKIEAPDHSPVILEGPHYLSQTANLFDPINAD